MNKRMITAATTFGAAAMVFSAAALAQTPSPGTTVTPGATTSPGLTGTVSPVASGTVGGTVSPVASGTVSPVASGTVSGTAVSGTPGATGTVTGTVGVIPTIPVPTSIYVPGGTGNFPFADSAFQNVWNRTDAPVKSGQVSRTWFWGPGPNTPGLREQYNQGTGGQRTVQYFDKSRMELNNPGGNRNDPFFVTNGLLTVELISGFIQVGDSNFNRYHPACIPMSGDFGDTLAPTYFAFQGVSNTQAGDHPAADRTGQTATQTINRNGTVGTDASKGNVPGVNLVHFEAQTKHNIPKIFWDFLNSTGPISGTNGQIANEQLINPWFFASGLPISEPYWAQAKIGGQVKDVLIQAFERRALTYVPTNTAGFQVEMANIGQHYFDWRYRNYGYCTSEPVTTPTAPVPAVTGTVVTGTVVSGTTTPGATGTTVSGTTTPGATGTSVSGTTTPAATTTSVSGTTTPAATTTSVSGTATTITGTPLATISPVGTVVP